MPTWTDDTERAEGINHQGRPFAKIEDLRLGALPGRLYRADALALIRRGPGSRSKFHPDDR